MKKAIKSLAKDHKEIKKSIDSHEDKQSKFRKAVKKAVVKKGK